nr:hypothetical protein [Tanacetum cinerariifolium]
MGDVATQTRSERVSKFSDDPPLSRVNILESRKDRLELKELMELCIKLSDMVLDLEKTKTAQAKEIANLKKTEARKEKEVKISWVKRLYKVGLSARVESSAKEESLGEGESSKQRRIEDIDADDNITLANDQEMFDADRDLQGEEVVTRQEKEVDAAFNKTMSWINSFVPMDSKVVKDKVVLTQESSSKRVGDELDQERSKKQKVEDDKESKELKRCLEIIQDDGDYVTIEATPLSIKTPIINYKIYKEGRKSYFQIIRVDRNLQMYYTFSKLLKNFDKEDLEVL